MEEWLDDSLNEMFSSSIRCMSPMISSFIKPSLIFGNGSGNAGSPKVWNFLSPFFAFHTISPRRDFTI